MSKMKRVNGLTSQRIKIIKTLYNGIISVELPLNEENLNKYEVGKLYYFKDESNNYNYKSFIRKVKLCPEYKTGVIFLTVELL